jgi:hypothetical protein
LSLRQWSTVTIGFLKASESDREQPVVEDQTSYNLAKTLCVDPASSPTAVPAEPAIDQFSIIQVNFHPN